MFSVVKFKELTVRQKEALLWGVFFIIFGLAVFLRFFHLGTNDFWCDEAVVVLQVQRFSQNSLVLPSKLFQLYADFMYSWTSLFGTGEFSFRVPSVIFSCLALWLLFQVARKHFSRSVAFYATTLMCFSSFGVWYAQEARPYSLVSFLAIASVYLFLEFMENRRQVSFLLLLVVSILGIHAHVCYVFLIIAQVVFFLFRMTVFFTRRNLLFLLFLVAGVLVCIPQITYFLKHFFHLKKGFWIPSPSFLSFPVTLKNFLFGYNLGISFSYFAGILIALLAVYSLYFSVTVRHNQKTTVLGIFFIVPFVVCYAISYMFFPVYLDRLLITVFPVFFLLLAIVLCSIRSNVFRNVVFFSLIFLQLCGIQAYFMNEMPANEGWRHVGVHLKKTIKKPLAYLKENVQKEDGIAFASPASVPSFFCYGFLTLPVQGRFFLYKEGDLFDVLQRPIKENKVLLEMPLRNVPLEKIVGLSCKKLWVISNDWERTGNLRSEKTVRTIKKYMDAHFNRVSEKEFDGLFISCYLLK